MSCSVLSLFFAFWFSQFHYASTHASPPPLPPLPLCPLSPPLSSRLPPPLPLSPPPPPPPPPSPPPLHLSLSTCNGRSVLLHKEEKEERSPFPPSPNQQIRSPLPTKAGISSFVAFCTRHETSSHPTQPELPKSRFCFTICQSDCNCPRCWYFRFLAF